MQARPLLLPLILVAALTAAAFAVNRGSTPLPGMKEDAKAAARAPCRYRPPGPAPSDRPPVRFEAAEVGGDFLYAYGLAASDLDGDGRLDITVADAIAGNLSILYQTKSGHFTRSIIASGEGWYERHRILDGAIYVTKNKAGEIARLTKEGPSSWTEEVIIREPWVFDLDIVHGDGLELAVSTHGAGRLVTFKQSSDDPAAAFESLVVADDLGYVKAARYADFNGDGHRDILSASSDLAEVFFIDGKSGRKVTVGQGIEFPMLGDVGDLDGDGDLDIAIAAGGNLTPANVCNTGVFWFENTHGGAAWIRHPVHNAIASGFEAVLADLDGDGDLDVVASYYQNPAMIVWYENRLPDDWLPRLIHASYETQGANQIIPADVNSDGKLDLVTAWADGLSKVIIFYRR